MTSPSVFLIFSFTKIEFINFDNSVEYSVIPRLFDKIGVLISFSNSLNVGSSNAVNNSLTRSARKLHN